MKNSIEEALEDAQAEAAFDAQSRHERGEAQPDEPAFTEAELGAMASLRPAADAERDEAFRAALEAALLPAGQRRTPPSLPTRGRGSVSPLRFLTRARVTVATTLAMAAALAVLVVQPYAYDGDAGQPVLESGDRVLGSSQPEHPKAIAPGACVGLDVPLKTDAALSDSLTAYAYFQKGPRTVRWEIAPQIEKQALTLPQCAPLPAGLEPGEWTLVLLVGYPGRLRWLASDALSQAAPGPSSVYRGIRVLRKAVPIENTP